MWKGSMVLVGVSDLKKEDREVPGCSDLYNKYC